MSKNNNEIAAIGKVAINTGTEIQTKLVIEYQKNNSNLKNKNNILAIASVFSGLNFDSTNKISSNLYKTGSEILNNSEINEDKINKKLVYKKLERGFLHKFFQKLDSDSTIYKIFNKEKIDSTEITKIINLMPDGKIKADNFFAVFKDFLITKNFIDTNGDKYKILEGVSEKQKEKLVFAMLKDDLLLAYDSKKKLDKDSLTTSNNTLSLAYIKNYSELDFNKFKNKGEVFDAMINDYNSNAISANKGWSHLMNNLKVEGKKDLTFKEIKKISDKLMSKLGYFAVADGLYEKYTKNSLIINEKFVPYLDSVSFNFADIKNTFSISDKFLSLLNLNEKIGLYFLLSGRKDVVKEVMGDKYDKFIDKLKNIGVKLDLKIKTYKKSVLNDLSNSSIAYLDVLVYKKTQGKGFVDSSFLLSIKSKDELKNFLKIVKQFKLGFDPRLSEGLEKGQKFVDLPIEEQIKKIEELKKIQENNMFLALNGIKSFEGENNDKLNIIENVITDKFKKLNLGFTHRGDGFDKYIKEIFSKKGIEQMKSEYRHWNGDFISFLDNYLFKENHGGYSLSNFFIGKLSDPTTRYKIIRSLNEVILNEIKGNNLLETRDLVKKSELGKLVDKNFNQILNNKTLTYEKKALFVNEFDYVLGKVIVDHKKELKNGVLTAEFLTNNRDKIENQLKEVFPSGKDGKQLNSMVEKLFNKLLQDPELKKGIKLNLKQIENLASDTEMIKKMEKDIKRFNELGVTGYIEYEEKQENEKKLNKQLNNIEPKPVSNFQLPEELQKSSDKVQTTYVSKDGLEIAYAKFPGQKDGLELKAINKADLNKTLINNYFDYLLPGLKSANLKMDVKGSPDLFAKITGKDITKDALGPESFEKVDNFFKTFVYDHFFGDKATEKEKQFVKKYDLKAKDLFDKTKEGKFFEQFSLYLKGELSIGGLKNIDNNLRLDLSNVDYKLFDPNYQKQTKEKILDGKTNVFSKISNSFKKVFS